MDYSITAYRAAGDGETEDTIAVQAAIDACAAAGGGRVVVPPGVYMIGTVQLKDRVELHLERGATLRGIFNGDSYRAIDPQHQRMTALVFARDAVDVAITGGGTIDGQGSRYWRKLDAPRSSRADVDEVGVIQFWYEHMRELSKPNRLVAFLRCRHVQVRDVHLTGAVSWTCHVVGCRDVKIRGIDILNPIYGPNTDGIDIDGSSDVLIADCTIETGDDAIVLKTTNLFGTCTPIRNVTVTNCRLHSGCNAFKIGTETEEDVENVCFSNSAIYSPNDARPIERCISGIALETVDGGSVRNVTCSNITMTNARTPIFLRLGERLRSGARTSAGEMRGIVLSNIVATGATHPSVISGIPGHRIEDVQIQNLQIETRGGSSQTAAEIGAVPENAAAYPEVFMFGTVPAAALYLRHVDRLAMGSLFVRLRKTDARPLCFADHVEQMTADRELFQ
ncbi:MAG TPA: glycosyl hydrolase family 28 protein [Tepidisphaeraceae bacterium]|nr:glycosyl hydrolase family 28 protein [Tepidisphaeraceae bacterium]